MVTPVTGIVAALQLESAAFIRDMSIASQATARAATNMQKSVKKIESTFVAASNAVNKFANALGGLFAIQQIMAAAKALADYSDAWQQATNMIAAAEQISGRQARSLEALNLIAQETRTSIADTADLYAKLLRVTANVAESEEEVAKATEIVTKAFKAGGASLSEQVNGIRQLAQALGSGVLQGDELRSIRENAPLVAAAIAKEFQTTIAGLKKLGAEGALTSDRVFKAILASEAEIGAAFGRTNATIAESFTVLNNAFTQYIAQVNKHTGASNRFAKAIIDLSTNFDAIADQTAKTSPLIQGFNLWTGIFKFIKAAIKEAVENFSTLETHFVAVTDAGADSTTQLFAYAGALRDVAIAGRLAGATPVEDIFRFGIDPDIVGDPLRTFDQQIKDWRKAVVENHEGLIRDIGTPYEQWKQKAEDIKKQYIAVEDQIRATSVAQYEYERALNSTAITLGAVFTPQELHIQRLKDIAAAGLPVELAQRAVSDSVLEMGNALDQQRMSLGLMLSPMEAHAAKLREIALAHDASVTAAQRDALAMQAYGNALIAQNAAMGLQADPIAQFMQAQRNLAVQQALNVNTTNGQIAAHAALAASTLDLAGQVTGAFAGLFKDNKALAVANAVISTAEAIVKTLAMYGATPWGIAAAAVAATVGAAQIATILSAEPGGSKSIKSPKSGKTSSAPANAGAASRGGGGLKQAVTINIKGESFGPEHFRRLVDGINGVIQDGAVLRINK